MGLEKLKFDKIMLMLQKNWSMMSMHLLSYGYMWEVAKHSRS